MNIITMEMNLFEQLQNRLMSLNERVEKLASTYVVGVSDWIDNQQVCEILNISYRTLQSYRQRGLLTYTAEQNKIYYRKRDIINFLKSRTVCKK